MITVHHSHYWQESQLRKDSLAKAYQELIGAGSADMRFAAFLELLRSKDSVAVGVAMDHYQMSESSSRMGGMNPLDTYSAEVLNTARATLASPPSPASLSPLTGEGANHASALLAMANMVTPRDAPLIRIMLESTTNDEVRSLALASCARAVGGEGTDDSGFVQLLGMIAHDACESPHNRISAIRALAGINTDQSAEVLSIAMDDPDVMIQAHIALGILQMTCAPQWIPRLKRLAASWPSDAPFPADDVRDLLEDQ